MKKNKILISVVLLLVFIGSFINLVSRKATFVSAEVMHCDEKKEQIINQISEDTIEIEIPANPIEIEIPDDEIPL
ncbi:hypothetical protein KPL42_11320 [Clostridium gasigenes]|uniref:hypothetical protein n=1 Tax=Clostridium gasigenes TaxID=94869 RepID=UPI001C0BD28D|nr:hypothetical protein [Clostridium gasigenes]MBU3089076.1 hypothetical protein [Clostridium gasigenes]